MPECFFCKKEIKAPYEVILLTNNEGAHDLRYDYVCPLCMAAEVLPRQGIGASYN